MEFSPEELKARLKELVGSWPGYVALGSFTLYLLGYLSLRFHLTVLGIGTDLKVLDERYIFAGAKFLVYLFSTVATVALIALLFSPLIIAVHRLMNRYRAKPWARWAYPLVGIVLSALAIQVVMKQCFAFSNLLVARELPWTAFDFDALLTAEKDTGRALYFVGLVAVTILCACILIYVRKSPAGSRSPFLSGLLAFLLGVQFLLLPVNYGVFIMDKQMPKVTHLETQTPLAGGQEAWLIWEGDAGVTYLVRGPEQDPPDENGKVKPKRRLVTVPKGEVKRTEIVGYDPIFARIFGGQ